MLKILAVSRFQTVLCRHLQTTTVCILQKCDPAKDLATGPHRHGSPLMSLHSTELAQLEIHQPESRIPLSVSVRGTLCPTVAVQKEYSTPTWRARERFVDNRYEA